MNIYITAKQLAQKEVCAYWRSWFRRRFGTKVLISESTLKKLPHKHFDVIPFYDFTRRFLDEKEKSLWNACEYAARAKRGRAMRAGYAKWKGEKNWDKIEQSAYRAYNMIIAKAFVKLYRKQEERKKHNAKG